MILLNALSVIDIRMAAVIGALDTADTRLVQILHQPLRRGPRLPLK